MRVRGLRGRGEINGDGIAGVWPVRDRVAGKKFRDRKSRETQEMPRGARAIVVANDFDSHGFQWDRLFILSLAKDSLSALGERPRKSGTTNAHG